MENSLSNFIISHEGDDIHKLMLSASRYPDIDMKKAVSVIQARKKIKDKIPSWYSFPEIEYPLSLSVEQGSSELTARYKCRFVNEGDRICDITGGMGVDSYFMSLKAGNTEYHERNTELFEATERNFHTLGADNIICRNIEVDEKYLETLYNEGIRYDLIYADPARRSRSGSRIYSISDCEPDITRLKESLFKVTDRILVKISTMADIRHTVESIQEISLLHVIACGNECKELLILMEKGFCNNGDIPVYSTDLSRDDEGTSGVFSFRLSEEKSAIPQMCPSAGVLSSDGYLYEPGKAILKAGAFRILSERYAVMKLAPATHLYFSTEYRQDFPGKIFRIMEVLRFTNSNIKAFRDKYPEASVSARNIPVTSDDLRKKLKVRESDEIHCFGTMTTDGEKILVVCKKA